MSIAETVGIEGGLIMALEMPAVEEYMTPTPVTVDHTLSVSKARDELIRYDIRHLPVLCDGKLCGVVTEREIEVALVFPGPGELVVGDLIARAPYVVHPDTPLDEVVEEMAEHKYGCAIVIDERESVLGIFTDVDALRVCDELLQNWYRFNPAA